MHISFIAQSGFILKDSNIIIGIDLWLNNPINPKKLSDIEKLDYLFLTHDHRDHGKNDMLEIVQRDGANFICSSGTAKTITQDNLKITSGSIGGSYKVDHLEVINTHAFHSSDTGEALGYIIKFGDKTIYHLGDTGFYSEMEDYAKMYPTDVLFIPIGGFYTMGPKEAAYAVNKIKPKYVIPMHYNTSEKIEQDPEEFKQLVKEYNLNAEIIIMKPGEKIEI